MTNGQIEFVILLMVIAGVAHQLFSKQKKATIAHEKPRKKWSGKNTGPFAIKALTREQSYCLGSLINEDFVGKGTPSRKDGIEYFPAATINALVKHGFIEELKPDQFSITDHGLNAYDNLRWR